MSYADPEGLAVETLVHVDGDRVTWSDAVVRVADALNPISSLAHDIAKTITTIAACRIEIRKLHIKEMELSALHDIHSSELRHRQAAITRAFDMQIAHAQSLHVTYQVLITGHETAHKMQTDRSLPNEDRLLYRETALDYAKLLASVTTSRGNQLVRLVDSLDLTPISEIVAPWRQIEL
ncbi:hypothetical protein GCM10027059_30330 [Myceligenerans halotolerans]